MGNREFDELGRNIQELVEKAVNTQNYQKLSQTISQTINDAISSGSDSLREVFDDMASMGYSSKGSRMQQYSARPIRTSDSVAGPKLPSMQSLYKSMTGSKVKGILEMAFGAVLTLSMGGGLIANSVIQTLANGGMGSSISSILMGIGMLVGIGLFGTGARLLTKADRFIQYVKCLGGKTYCEIDKLAKKVGKTPKFVLKDLKRMIAKGWFKEGHIDQSETSLITSEKMFEEYRELQREIAEQQERIEQEAKAVGSYSKEVQEVLDKGNEFLQKIHQSNDAIPGEVISQKISRMELLVQKIFERAKEHPEIIPDLKKLMNYYLPMTVKLLDAYEDMDRQTIQGENITNSKKEIESTIDTLNTAFEKLLDSVYQDTALDISSDITVLQTLLAQEGLTEDELQKMKDQSIQMPSN
ncbi:MAG: 5-bromo-4-chloroindolyl phosphate hydrolysis family protein [Eubacteriales bacterium]|nr:5-bromo-4-chloroindolyl phosphate hydrolysis family protein [Eubacteriales bacterium]